MPILNNNLQRLDSLLRCSTRELAIITRKAPRLYRTKKIPKDDGSFRVINPPSPKLKELQRQILKNILRPVKPLPCVHSTHRRSALTNAKEHVNKVLVANFDIKNFFPSVKGNQIFNVYRKLGSNVQDATILTGLSVFKNYLPQGAPTSTELGNHVLAPLDIRLMKLAKKHELVYTRYVDDITLSGNRDFRDKLKDLVVSEIETAGFEVNAKKLENGFQYRVHEQLVTGYVVNERVDIQLKTIQKLEGLLQCCIVSGPESQNVEKKQNFAAHLHGRINFIATANVNAARRLLNLYNKICWGALPRVDFLYAI